jgi:ribonuclease-3
LSDALDRLQAALGYRFRDRSLLEHALTHRSHSHERGAAAAASYERLEFLGDALLGFVVSVWLYRDDRAAAEGLLSRRRQGVVRAETLASAALGVGLGDAARLGRGEEQTGGRSRQTMLADLFEAVLGAVYLDGGLRAATALVRRHLGESLELTRGASATPGDHKTLLQEQLQADLQRTPRYRIVSTTGPDHALEFTAEVLLGDELLGRGTGPNRKSAEQQAAQVALERLALRER